MPTRSSSPAPTACPDRPALTVLGPHPLLSIDIEARADRADEIHLHPAGQGVWVARVAAELGADPTLCGFIGGETGAVLRPLLAALPGEQRLIAIRSASGCYVTDGRDGPREPVAQSVSAPPTRHELDDLAAATIAACLRSGVLVLCNPYPGDAVTPDFYERIVADVRPHGVRILADLSSPRLQGAIGGGIELVKINDWELAELVSGPVATDADLRAAVARIQQAGVETVVITRGEQPAMVFRRERSWTLRAPVFTSGFREGCGDSMMGALAAVLARGGDWREALIVGAAAGAANFLRHGLGSADAATIAELTGAVTLTPAD